MIDYIVSTWILGTLSLDESDVIFYMCQTKMTYDQYIYYNRNIHSEEARQLYENTKTCTVDEAMMYQMIHSDTDSVISVFGQMKKRTLPPNQAIKFVHDRAYRIQIFQE